MLSAAWMEKVMLSVIAVNYNSSALLKECFSSIVSTIGDESFEFLAIDSGSREEEVNSLQSLDADNVKILLNEENIGYARAVNTGIKNARGDRILITNPDVLYKPNCIKKMLNALVTFPRCGAIGPKTWWNKEMTFLLPLGELITPFWIFNTDLMRVSRTIRSMVLRRWIKQTLRYWISKKPIKREMLSGACLMTTKRVLDVVGGFDDSFSLYFEDTDWCLRVRKAGYHLYMLPEADIVHYYNQSAKQDTSASQKKFNDSLTTYLRKHFNGLCYLTTMFRRLVESIPYRGDKTYDDMGILTAPPVFIFKDSSKKLLLLSPLELMIPSAGSFIEGKTFTLPEDLWDCLGDGRYFVRVFNPVNLTDYSSWSWIKQTTE